MELSPRKENILATIVRTYIKTGDPVGSKTLCESLGSVSSATIRNEMSELAELGYLDQPHTSAGRIPTDRGFRLYIDKLMREHVLTENERCILDSFVPKASGDCELMLRRAAAALSSATRCLTLLTSETGDSTLIHKVELVAMSAHSALLVLITSSGTLHNRMFRFATPLSAALIERFTALVEKELIGTPVSSFQPALLQTLVAGAGEHAFVLTELMSALGELITETAEAKLELSGQSNLLEHEGFSVLKAREIFDLLNRRDEVLSLLETCKRDSGVILGCDTSYSALDKSGLVIARYRISDAHTGYIGIIGPLRMNYDVLVPSIKYFAGSLCASASHGDEVKGQI